MTIAWLLGAGFSRHVHESMPMMPDLGRAARAYLANESGLLGNLGKSEREAIESGHLPLDDIELFLTSLMSDQPYLSTRERYGRRAVAEALTNFVAEFVGRAQAEAMQSPPPPWLKSLLALWHHRRDSVLTLNYDTLVENAVQHLSLEGPSEVLPGRRVTTSAITRGYPLRMPRQGLFGEDPWPETFRLIKLHGSLSWRRMSGTGEVRQLVESIAGWQAVKVDLPEDLEPHLVGAFPALLLPQADKSAAYREPVISNLWTTAREHLERCDRLIIFGYSLPRTDTSVPALLFQATRRSLPITIIDPSAQDVRDRLRAVGIEAPGENINPLEAEQLNGFLNRSAMDLATTLEWTALDGMQPPFFVETQSIDGVSLPVMTYRDGLVTNEVELEVADEPLVSGSANRSNTPLDHSPAGKISWKFRRSTGTELFAVGFRREKAHVTGTNVTVHVIPEL